MSDNNARKSAARRLAMEQGIKYVHALRILDEQQQDSNPSHATLPQSSLRKVLLDAVDGSLEYTEVANADQEHSSGMSFNGVMIPETVENITIQHVDPDPATLDWTVDQTFNQTTKAITITMEAEVSFEGYMYRSDWWGRDGSEDDGITGPSVSDMEDHYVEVRFTRPAKLTYTAVVEVAGPAVESLECVGAEAVHVAAVGRP